MNEHAEFNQINEYLAQAASRQPDALRFDKQAAVAGDNSRNVALLCGRRAGKTEELAYEAAEALEDNERARVVFVGLTAKSAREIFFAKICALNSRLGWGFQTTEQPMTVTSPRTLSRLLIVGSDTRDDLDKIRGLERLALLICDEAGQWRPSLLEYVVNEAAGPALMDLRGRTILSGTPGRILSGYWYELTSGRVQGWSVHRWTAYDNPHVPAAEWLDELLSSKGWDRSHAVFRREYLAEWCTDTAALVMSAFSDSNIAPCEYEPGYRTLLSMDFGVVHNTAFGVLGHRPDVKPIKVFHAEQAAGLAPTQVADRGKALKEQYACSRVIGDLGGMGKAHAAEFDLRHHIHIEPADKRDKYAAIELVNDRFRKGELVIDPANKELIEQCRSVQWNEDHTDIADGQDDDLLEMLVYGNHKIIHQWVEPAPKPTKLQPPSFTQPKRPFYQVDLME